MKKSKRELQKVRARTTWNLWQSGYTLEEVGYIMNMTKQGASLSVKSFRKEILKGARAVEKPVDK